MQSQYRGVCNDDLPVTILDQLAAAVGRVQLVRSHLLAAALWLKLEKFRPKSIEYISIEEIACHF